MPKNFTVTKLNSPFDHYDFQREFAKKNNFHRLGSGVYASVYGSKASKYVYKIGRFYGHEMDDAYLNFVLLGPKNNLLFPKIRTVTIFKYNDREKFYVVEMERLQKCKVKHMKKESVKIRKDLLTLEDNGFDQKFMKKISSKYKSKPLPDMLKHLDKLFNNFSHDLHDANMMMRANGQLVITDPAV